MLIDDVLVRLVDLLEMLHVLLLLEDDLLQSTDIAEADLDDLDYDPNTDRYILIAWSSFSGNWPGSLPIKLFDLEVTASEAALSYDAIPIRFTASSTASGYALSGTSIYGRVIAASLDIDDDGGADALTDGLLIIRNLFGFSGESLVSNALAPEANVTDSADISARIASMADALDVDADGEVDALTDGLMIIRRLFGFSGESLVSDALAPEATRTDPDEIQAYIDGLVP